MRKQPTFRRKKLPQAKSRQAQLPEGHPLAAEKSTAGNTAGTPENSRVIYDEPELPTWTKKEDVIDYLSEDDTLPSQKFACISMLSLSKWRTGRQREEAIEGIIKKEGFDPEVATKIIDAWSDYADSKRALKIRGVYGTYPEAQKRAQALQNAHKNHNIAISSVGYWVPFDPDPELIADQNYMEGEMNQLKEGYAMNLEKGKLHFAEQKATLAQKARIDGSKWGQAMALNRKETKQEVEHRIKSAEEDIAQYTEKIKSAKLALEQAHKKIEHMASHPELILEEEDAPIDYDNVPKEVLDEIKERQKVTDANRDKLATIEAERKQYSRMPQPVLPGMGTDTPVSQEPQATENSNKGPLEEQLLLPHQARQDMKKYEAEQMLQNIKSI